MDNATNSIINYFDYAVYAEQNFKNNSLDRIVEIFKENGIIHQTSNRWGRFICKCEFIDRSNTNENKHHIYTPVINLKNGHIYYDCSITKTYAKIFIHTLARPFFALTEMVIEVVGLVAEIFIHLGCVLFIENYAFDLKELLVCELGHLVNLVRLPLYAIAMTIVSLVGMIGFLIIIPFSPDEAENLLFSTREHVGRLVIFQQGDQSSWYGKQLFLNSVICFKPRNLISFSEGLSQQTLKKHAGRILEDWTKNRYLGNCYQTIPKDRPYISPWYKEFEDRSMLELSVERIYSVDLPIQAVLPFEYC